MDTNLVMGYWGSDGGAQRSYHHTAPINPLYGLHEALLILREEGLENAWDRHRRLHLALRAGLEAMGLELAVAEAIRLPQLNAVRVPAGIDEAQVRRRLLEEHGLEIGGGLGALAGKVWRIGLMGHACNRRNVLLCLGALEAVLGSMGAAIARGVAVEAALAAPT
jgi:alanine-glyoxylate transaminase/serine-glyoxylate transaminase/serine-pyruvate transaminase